MSNRTTGPGMPDFSKPSVARVHDVLLGGHDNFAPDRELAARLTEICPALPTLVREDRDFLVRAVTWVAGQGSASSPTSEPGFPPGCPSPSRRRPSCPPPRWSTSTTTRSPSPTSGYCRPAAARGVPA